MAKPAPYPPPIVPADFKDVLDEPFAGPIPTPNLVAKTADDKQVHNTLSAVTFGVVKIQVKAGSAESKPTGGKSQLGPTPAKPAPAPGSDDFHYAAGKEKAQVVYTIEDAKKAITQAKLELFTRFDPAPIFSKTLDPADITDGDHTLDFIPSPTDPARFPDGQLTVEHSPYKLKITIGGKERSKSPVAWTFFHILVADITLELGDQKVLEPKHQQVCDLLKESLNGVRLPNPGETAELQLTSNIFKADDAEMSDGIGTSAPEPAYFREYKALWGDGPIVPIFAKVRVKDSANQPVDVPTALGRVKFLWDVEDVDEKTDRYQDAAAPHNPGKIRAFIENSLNFNKGVTTPKGDNCHEDRGGKRTQNPSGSTRYVLLAGGQQPAAPAPGSPPPADPALTAGVCPFEVIDCQKRKWAVFSFAWTRNSLAGKTGVLFQPSRMAGDAYKVSVFLAYDRNPDATLVLDTADAAPLDAAVKAATGTFQIWRRINVVRYAKKKSSMPDLDVNALRAFLEKAFIRLSDDTGGAKVLDEATYNSKLRNIISGLSDVVQQLVDPAVNQYTKGDYILHLRTFPKYLEAMKTARPELSDAAKMAKFQADEHIDTAAGYQQHCDFWSRFVFERAFATELDPRDGLNIFRFNGLNSEAFTTLSGGGWAAVMRPISGGAALNRHHGVFVSHPVLLGDTLAPVILSHETGHLLFLPHAPQGSPTPDGNQPLVHDKDWIDCLMSYQHNNQHPTKFCGFCLLTLRGWDRRKLLNNSIKNRNP